MGFDPLFAKGAEFTEWKTDALANQATTAGLQNDFIENCVRKQKSLLVQTSHILSSK